MDACELLGEQLEEFWQQFASSMRTKTRDTSRYGFHYLSGLLRLETDRTIANISRKTGQPEQNMQHFISESPWSGRGLIAALQDSIDMSGVLHEGVLIIDESADEKTSKHTAGVGRQHNGRLGKVDLCQVGVFASLATIDHHCWFDGELYIPEFWFEPEQEAKRKAIGIPKERTFQTKIELAWQLIERAYDNGISFSAVDMDSLYGRSFGLRQKLQAKNIEYYADIPKNTTVYLKKPLIYYENKQNGQPSKIPSVLGEAIEVQQLVNHRRLEVGHLRLRPAQRGYIEDKFARLPVWTYQNGVVLKEWLLLRLAPKQTTYVLSNASPKTSLRLMAERKTHRYFIERDNQDSKSEFGWDEFQATKYIAWEHQLAFTIMAGWFVTQARVRWAEQHPQNADLLQTYEVDVLPQLSVANVRELLRAAMPVPQLSPQEATELVMKHLKNRTKSRRSRRKEQHRTRM